MTFKENNDMVMDHFRRLGSKRFSDGINPPPKKKEHTVTLTNNIRAIETSAQLALKHCDEKKYPLAHLDLDVIEAKVRIVRTHIDHLQNVTDFAVRPAGGD